MRAMTENAVYGLTALHTLMRAGQPMKRRALAMAARTPTELLPTLLTGLEKAGLISGDGRSGYVLAKAPGEIRLQEVVQALDPPEAPGAPCGGNFDACDSRSSCVLAVLCRRADAHFRDLLREFTLEDLREMSPDLPNCIDPLTRSTGKHPST